jgi:hypothetical protein
VEKIILVRASVQEEHKLTTLFQLISEIATLCLLSRRNYANGFQPTSQLTDFEER